MKRFILVFFIFLSSCTLGPDYERPEFFQDKEIEKSLALKFAHKDVQPIDLKDETLTTVIEKGRQNSPDIKTAMIKLRQARENLKIVEVANFPTIDLNAKYNYMKESRTTGYLVDQDYYQLGADVNWEIDIFGGGRRRSEAAQADSRAMIENLKNVWVSLEAEIISVYLDLRMSEILLKNARENLDLQKNIYQMVSLQSQAGLADDIALNNSQYLIETTRAQIPTLEAQKKLYQNTLALLVGELPESLNALLEKKNPNIVNRKFTYPLNGLYQVPVGIIRNRPDVRMAEENLIAKNAAVGAAIADMFPKVDFSAILGFQSLKLPNLMNHKSYGYSYVPEVTMPLFHFQSLMNNVKLQEQVKEEALVAYQNTLLTAINDVKTALINLDKEIRVNDSALSALNKINRVNTLTLEKYSAGLAPFSDVLTAQQNLIQAQNVYVQSNAMLYQNIVQFYKSIGGRP